VNPQPVVANATVDVLGVRLVPQGETPETAAVATSVRVRDLAAAVAPSAVLGVAAGANAAKVSFTMPLVFAGKDVDIRVVTAGAVATAPYRVTVAAAP
jgi:hypothetical protein